MIAANFDAEKHYITQSLKLKVMLALAQLALF